MTWFIVGLLVGAAIGVIGMSLMAAGALADARAEMADCRERVRRLTE
jgi:hypothetical protein